MAEMAWSTGIAQVQGDDVVIRGRRLSDLIGTLTYAEMAFLLIRGDLPTAGERDVLEAILVSLADHGISPTTIVARTLTSCGAPIQASMAGAALSIADWHGGSGEEVGRILKSINENTPHGTDLHARCAAYVDSYLSTQRQLPGYGHPQHSDGDPRARTLLDIGRRAGVSGVYCETLDFVGECLAKTTSRAVLRQPNVTGAVAALLMDLGFPWQSIRGIVIAARSLGLTAHIVEELEQGNKWRHVPATEVHYTGPLPT